MNQHLEHPGLRAQRSDEGPVDSWDAPDVIRAAFSIRNLVAHRRLIATTTALLLALAALYLVVRPDSYMATTSIIVGSNVTNAAGQRQRIREEGDLQTQMDLLNRLTARHARLESSLRGEADVTFPPQLLRERTSDTEIDTILGNEALLHEARRSALESKLESLRQLLEFTKKEIESLKEQVSHAVAQQNSIDKELEGVRALAKKGLAPATRLGDLERTAATFATRRLETETELLRRQQEVYEIEQRITDATHEARTETLVELQQTTTDLRATEFKIGTFSGLAQPAPADPGALANQMEIMLSDKTAQEIVVRLGFASDPDFFAPSANPVASAFSLLSGKEPIVPGSPEATVAAAKRIQSALSVVRGATLGSRLDISYEAEEPEQARQVVTAYAEKFTDPSPADNSATPGDGSQLLRAASVVSAAPPAPAVLLAAIFAGLALGAGAAFALGYVKFATRRSPAASES
jgi:capsular polysaccharide biosynthesis protein